MTPLSPIHYPGGKSRAVKSLRPYIPARVKRIVSPFIGGGSFEIALARAGIRVIGYDILAPLTSFWGFALTLPDALADAVQNHFEIGREGVKAMRKRTLALPIGLDQAAHFFVINRTSFGGGSFNAGAALKRFNQSSIDRLRRFRAPTLTVQRADYRESIERHPLDWLYLDPPYLLTRPNLYPNHRGFDHVALFDLLKDRKDWVLSYNDCDEIRQLYQGFVKESVSWRYSLGPDKQSKELVIFPKFKN